MKPTEPTKKETELYNSLIGYLNGIKANVVTKQPIDINQAFQLVGRMVSETALIDQIFPLTTKGEIGEDYMVTHQANVAVCALKLGLVLEFTAAQLLELGVVSLIHDLGIWNVPDSILNKKGPLTADELALLKDHSRTGKDILVAFQQELPWLPEVVFQHHERGNGTGYPRNLRLNQMHNYTPLLTFVDAYEAMTHHRPNRRALNQIFSTKELLTEFKESAFPEKIIKAFLREITFYPVGCHVLLNNQWVCEVVEVNPRNPLRPTVKLVINNLHRQFTERKIIRLAEFPTYNIVDYISLEDMDN